MKIHAKKFRVPAGKQVDLSDWPTDVKPFYDSKSEYRDLLDQHQEKLNERQNLLYAYNRYAVLLIFQAMDAAGKDGVIKHVMSGVNPQGCQVFSFKHPGPEELQHDFLWRTSRCLPERGRIGIFNRSYYEEVLIVRVHRDILAAENLPDGTLDDGDLWQHRFHSINEHEKHLHRNGTQVVKFFLHLSKEEQRERFLARIEEPEKNWKMTQADMEERKLWKQYMKAYEACLSTTSTKHAPWYIVPADDKHNARLIISQIIVDTLDGLKMNYPEPDKAHRKDLQAIRKQLLKEKGK
ncbi:MAG TPA: ADP-polyphosphate phosphotransferase [Candidatus Saccharimonadales bacterium]|nr:ADP-polyphosphate phosphotransferase [Candidatus Saccharimonadales bacterium]